MKYERLTKRNNTGRWGLNDKIFGDCHYVSADVIGERIAELEDKIENGELIQKHYIIEDCGFYFVCEVDTTSFIVLNQYETEEEAQKALKEIQGRRHAND